MICCEVKRYLIQVNFRIVIIISLLITSSCKYQISEENLEWNPYTAGDRYTYLGNFGKVFELYITKIEKVSTENAFTLTVHYAIARNPNSLAEESKLEEGVIMTLSASEFEDATMSINFSTSIGVYKFSNPMRLQYLDAVPKNTMGFDMNEFNDVLIFTADPKAPEYNENKAMPDFIDKLYWSKSTGLIGFNQPNIQNEWRIKYYSNHLYDLRRREQLKKSK